MELFKIIRIFFTAWFIVFAIIYLTRCKRSHNPKIDMQVGKSISIPSTNSVSAIDSLIAKPTPATPVTTSVVPRAKKPVKLIYLK